MQPDSKSDLFDSQPFWIISLRRPTVMSGTLFFVCATLLNSCLLEWLQTLDRRILSNSVTQLSKQLDRCGPENLSLPASESTSYWPWFAASAVICLPLGWKLKNVLLTIVAWCDIAGAGHCPVHVPPATALGSSTGSSRRAPLSRRFLGRGNTLL